MRPALCARPAAPDEGGETSFPQSTGWLHPEMGEETQGEFSLCAKGHVSYKPKRGDGTSAPMHVSPRVSWFAHTCHAAFNCTLLAPAVRLVGYYCTWACGVPSHAAFVPHAALLFFDLQPDYKHEVMSLL